MSDVESRALRRATVVLLVLSAGRWVASRPHPGAPTAEPSAGAAHAAATRAAAEEGVRRARPLGQDELLDPNRAPEEELDRLPGVGPATARAIVATRGGGVIFREPGDLAAVPGIGPAVVEKLRPHLDLSRPPAASAPAAVRAPGRPGSQQPVGGPRRGARSPVDLNRAGVDELVGLPGVGPVIAARIVAERRLGPFATLEDLMRVRGIGPAAVERLRGLATAR